MEHSKLVNEIEERKSLLLYLQGTGQLKVTQEKTIRHEMVTLEKLLDCVRR